MNEIVFNLCGASIDGCQSESDHL